MDLISQQEIEQLATYSNGICVSIFIPTHRAGEETLNGKDAKELKSQLQEVTLELKDLGWHDNKIEEFLQPASDLLSDSSFWRHNSDGLAIFLSDDHQQILRLPIYFESFHYVSREFYIRPLMPLRAKDGHFYILALGMKTVKFFECTKHTIAEIDIEDLAPTRLEEAVGFDWEESMLQFRSQQQGVPAAEGGSTGMGSFHGHSGDKADKKDEILQFFHQVNDGVMEVISHEHDPLLIACIDFMFPIYKEANKYPHLYDENISGNPAGKSAVELHKEGFAILEDHFDKKRKDKVDLFHQFKASEKASVQLEDIVPGAIHGKVDTLFIKNREDVYGKFLSEKNTIERSERHKPEDNQSLLNLAAAQTLVHGGNVYLVDEEDMPESRTEACAVFRY